MSTYNGYQCIIVKSSNEEFVIEFTLCSDDYGAGQRMVISSTNRNFEICCSDCFSRNVSFSSRYCPECGSDWNVEPCWPDYRKVEQEKKDREREALIQRSWEKKSQWEDGEYYYNRVTGERSDRKPR